MTEQTPARGTRPRNLLSRQNLFRIGEFLFLAAVGMITTLTMHYMHQVAWHFMAAMIVGMLAAMLVQMLMALCVAPLLGSIESMTPSMVIGMISPMSVCLLHMLGYESKWMAALLLGAVWGAGMFMFIECYGAMVKRALRKDFPLR